MFCYKCGKELKETDTFCPNCGVKVDGSSDTNMSYQNNAYDDEELLKAYIGKNYEKFINDKYNFWVGLFPGTYLLYRKQYLFFAILFVTVFLMGAGIMIHIGFAITMFFIFNGQYLKKANEDIEIIKRTNPNASKDELISLVSKKGGTNIIAASIFAIINIMLAALIILLLFLVLNESRNNTFDFWNWFGDYGYSEEYKTGNDEGKIKDLYYEVPNNYSVVNYIVDYTGKYIYPYATNSSCTIEITHINNTMEGYMKGKGELDKWEKKEINGYEYNYLIKENTNDKGYNYSEMYYAIEKNNNLYTFYFSDYNDVEEKCYIGREELFNSIKYESDEIDNILGIA